MASRNVENDTSLAFGLSRLVFPQRCCVCESPISDPGQTGHQSASEGIPQTGSLDFCPGCLNQYFSWRGQECPRCGSHGVVVSDVTGDCNRCRRTSFRVSHVVALGNYRDPLKQLVLAVKREKREALAFQLGRLLGLRLRERVGEGPVHIVPIPIHWWKRLRRGFHAPLVIADGIQHETGWPVAGDWLVMRRLTMKQGTLSTRQRFANMRNSMMVRASRRVSRRVVLVDDVMTSGATINEAATKLAAHGADEIWGAVVARGVRTS